MLADQTALISLNLSSRRSHMKRWSGKCKSLASRRRTWPSTASSKSSTRALIRLAGSYGIRIKTDSTLTSFCPLKKVTPKQSADFAICRSTSIVTSLWTRLSHWITTALSFSSQISMQAVTLMTLKWRLRILTNTWTRRCVHLNIISSCRVVNASL